MRRQACGPWLFGGQRLDELKRPFDPGLELPRGAHPRVVDVNHPLEGTTREIHPSGMGAGQRLFMPIRTYAYHEVVVHDAT